MNFRSVILFPLFLFLSLAGFAQQKPLDERIQNGIKEIYSIEFDKAETTFRGLMADYPQHPAGRFFLAMVDWWKILLDFEDESLDDLFFKKLEDIIYQCDQILDNDPNNIDALFFKGGAIGFRGRLRANRDSWLKAADDGREALPLVLKAGRLDPGNKDVQFGSGLYNYYVAVIPEKYPIYKPILFFFPSGDKEKGLQQLNDAAINGKYSKYEAQYFLVTLYMNYENNINKANEIAKQLCAQFPGNPIFQRWLGRSYVRMGSALEWHNTFYDIYGKCKKNVFGYNKGIEREASYYLGHFFKSQNAPDSAKIFLLRSAELSSELDKSEESGFYVNSVLFLADIYILSGDKVKAEEQYNKLLKMRDYNDSRRLAKEALQRIKGSN